MIRRQKRHIILIAWLQLFLLLFPVAAKLMHHHSHQSSCGEEKHTGYIITGERHSAACPICDFEFVQFVQPENVLLPKQPGYPHQQLSFYLSAVTVHSVALPSLRAPPAC